MVKSGSSLLLYNRTVVQPYLIYTELNYILNTMKGKKTVQFQAWKNRTISKLIILG